MEDALQANAQNLRTSIECWGANDSPIDLRALYLAWSADFITSKIIGTPIGLLRDQAKAESWLRDFSEFDKYVPLFRQLPQLVKLGLTLPLKVARILQPQLIPFLSLFKVCRRATTISTLILDFGRHFPTADCVCRTCIG